MKYAEIKKNLFCAENKYALAQCISLDCAMGKGIAVDFKKKFPGMKSTLLKTIKQNSINKPITILYKHKDRAVLNLITKKYYYNKPTYNSITVCIEQMKKLCLKNNIEYLAMPKIGCGRDKLNWPQVREIIKKSFEDTNINILVCKL